MSASPLQRIREMILSGALAPGERLTEIGLADELGVSRTPIRHALPKLEAEGYIEPSGKRGYAVRAFDATEAERSLELRASLEGTAARFLVENGISMDLRAALEACLEVGDQLFVKRYLNPEDEQAYGEMNARFHSLVVQNCGSATLISFVERLNSMPFIDPAVVVFNQIGLDRAYDQLFRSHGQHHAILEAMFSGDGARAELLFREHGNAQRLGMFSRAREKGHTDTLRSA